MAKTKLLILGTHSFSEEVADLASDIEGFEVSGFVENWDRNRCEMQINGLPVYWIDEIGPMASTHKAICAISTTRRSCFTDQAAQIGISFTTLIHPSARVSSTTTLGPGSIVSAGAVIAAHTTIGNHVIINRGALIGHHTVLGDHVTLGPGANICGSCRIGDATYIGVGAVVIDHVSIGPHSIVGAGAVVIADFADHVQVLGIPAKIVKENIEGK
jgi:acetyltransferase EpsM